MIDLSLENEDSSTAEEKPKGKIEDLPKELPSVRNLASIFTKKSPEPLPRRSIIKVSKNKPSKMIQHIHTTSTIHSFFLET